MADLGLRPEVRAFANLMEDRLRQNDHKGGWKACQITYLQDKLDEERAEFENGFAPIALALAYYGSRVRIRACDRARAWLDPARLKGLADEAADEANILMMLLDVIGALPGDKPDA
jgi:hypothetical protein